jgi:hypothetical protein
MIKPVIEYWAQSYIGGAFYVHRADLGMWDGPQFSRAASEAVVDEIVSGWRGEFARMRLGHTVYDDHTPIRRDKKEH